MVTAGFGVDLLIAAKKFINEAFKFCKSLFFKYSNILFLIPDFGNFQKS